MLLFRCLGSREGVMGLMEVILTVCSLAHPAQCDDRHLQFASEGTLRMCMANAQPYLAQWIGNHPDLRIVKWRCAYPDKAEQSL
jgi:hypothetical protein